MVSQADASVEIQRRPLVLRFRDLFCFAEILSPPAGDQRCFFRSTRNSTIWIPSVCSNFRCRDAYGSGISSLPRSPTTRCQGMPFPEGVAAIALPAVLAPPRKRNALANAPYVITRPRGICFTNRYTGSQLIEPPFGVRQASCRFHRHNRITKPTRKPPATHTEILSPHPGLIQQHQNMQGHNKSCPRRVREPGKTKGAANKRANEKGATNKKTPNQPRCQDAN